MTRADRKRLQKSSKGMVKRKKVNGVTKVILFCSFIIICSCSTLSDFLVMASAPVHSLIRGLAGLVSKTAVSILRSSARKFWSCSSKTRPPALYFGIIMAQITLWPQS